MLAGIKRVTTAPRLSAWIGLAFIFSLWGRSSGANAQTVSEPAIPPIVVETQGGWHGPLGVLGLSLLYDPGGRYSGGVGFGVAPSSFGFLGRFRAFRSGPLVLGLATTLSAGHAVTRRTYYPPTGQSWNSLSWEWSPGYRATGAVAAEYLGQQWSLRLEAGMAYLLNEPRCSYRDEISSYSGDCDSSLIPGPYHFSVQPGRVIPSIVASVGFRFGVRDPMESEMKSRTGVAKAPSLYRSPSRALSLSLGLSFGAVATGSMLLIDKSYGPGLVLLGLGLVVAPSAGHFYAGESAHGWWGVLGRTVGFGLGSFLMIEAWTSSIGEYARVSKSDALSQAGIGSVFVLGSLALGIYDIIDAPRAARRSNARHGLTDVGLSPMATLGDPTVVKGVAMHGRF